MALWRLLAGPWLLVVLAILSFPAQKEMSVAKLSAAVVAPKAKHTATIIFCHGLGDSGHGWSDVGTMLAPAFPYVKWVFPHAPERSITVNGGARMPGWYDIVSLERIQGQEDKAGMLQSASQLNALIETELDSGIPNHRILIGGFSQGAAMSYLVGLSSSIKLGGIMALSGYLPLSSTFDEWAKTANRETPLFVAHGSADPVVQYQYGKSSVEILKEKGYKVQFETYRGMQHSACNQELEDLSTYISSRLR
ncbi:hypothetical protein HDU91_000069 [Kappamyces sp. JEL0680]|nr:hypothetical protein HDU91_000069 [Kappamyces sp. JEL0680]